MAKHLDEILSQEKAKKRDLDKAAGKDKPVGRPPASVVKKQTAFYLPLWLIDLIDENHGNNKSAWCEKIFKAHFVKEGILVDEKRDD